MARYVTWGAAPIATPEFFNYPTRADMNIRQEYFNDFILGGTRDKRIYGQVRVTPEITVAYDVSGLAFLKYVLGSMSVAGYTISVADPPAEIATFAVEIEDDKMWINSLRVDTWEFTAEAGNPARVEMTARGRNWGTTDMCGTYSTDYSQDPVMLDDMSVYMGATSIDALRFNVRLSNNIESIFKSSTIASSIRATGLNIEGNIRLDRYGKSGFPTEGTLQLRIPTIGTITFPTARYMDIPPRVTGFNIPETEIGFQCYPAAGVDAVNAVIVNSTLW